MLFPEPPNQGQKKKQGKGDGKGEGKGEAGAAKKNRTPAARGRGGERAGREGITVVSAFEGYAFDAGMRAGDRITAINGKAVEGMTVDKVGRVCACDCGPYYGIWGGGEVAWFLVVGAGLEGFHIWHNVAVSRKGHVAP